nr:hypothetical protein [Providencia sp. wls1914]
MFKAKVKEEIFHILKCQDVLSINDQTLLNEILNEVINDLTVVRNISKLKDWKMTQAHKQQYKYKLTDDSFSNKQDESLKYIVPVILFAIVYLISKI